MSPAFAVVNPKIAPQKVIRTAAPNLSGFRAAPVRWPLCFVLAGVLSLVGGGLILLAQPDLLGTYHYTPHAIAITHLFVLGFISSIVMGAMYQLVPVTLEVRLYSERLVKFQFITHVLGFVGMVWAFWNFNLAWMGGFGCLLSLGVGLFIFNLARTLAKVDGWRAIKFGIASSLFWLGATVFAGLLLLATKFWACSPFLPMAAMHAHAHLGVAGVFVLLIITVSYKLVPMFTLSELQSERRAWRSVALFNVGLAGAFAAILWQSLLKSVCALLIIAALLTYGWEMLAILRARNRRTLDWGMKYFVTAIALLVPISCLGLLLSLPQLPVTALTMQLENVYGLAALLGLVGLAILGMLYKIVPFLVWFHSYSRHVGRAKVPALADMYSATLQAAGYWTYLAAFTLMSLGTAFSNNEGIRLGCVVLALSLGIFVLNLARMLSHLMRPRVETFALQNQPMTAKL